MSVIATLFVPFSLMVTPISGSPFVSLTRPDTLIGAAHVGMVTSNTAMSSSPFHRFRAFVLNILIKDKVGDNTYHWNLLFTSNTSHWNLLFTSDWCCFMCALLSMCISVPLVWCECNVYIVGQEYSSLCFLGVWEKRDNAYLSLCVGCGVISSV